MSWFIWLSKNKKIFENQPPSIDTVFFKVLGLYKRWKTFHLDLGKIKTLVKPILIEDTPMGWFDGETQLSGTISGTVGLNRINKISVYRWNLCCGLGTNTRA